MTLALLIACSLEPKGEPGSVLLARHPELLQSLVLPDTNRAGMSEPGRTELRCDWAEERRVGPLVEWVCVLPARTVNYWNSSATRPPGLQVFEEGGQPLSFHPRRPELMGPAGSFSHRDGRIFVIAEEAPSELYYLYPQAQEEEGLLNLGSSGLDPTAFAFRSLPLRKVFRHGLYLPAPAEAVFEVEVPRDGQLSGGVVLLPPALPQGERSDGVTLVVEVEHEGRTREVEELQLDPGGTEGLDVDLSRWEGQTITLRFRTLERAGNTLDYLFISEPSIHTPKEAPGRVAGLFLDTLRQDHLGAYGYERPVSPTLDALAEQGVVYEQARAPAPWTLPSGRAALTGRNPDAFVETEHMGRWFAEQGWMTAAVVGNTYMTRNFDMATGWSVHRGEVGTNAREATNRAIQAVNGHPDQDLALVVHYMDAHMPYVEPEEHRLWASPEPPVPLLGAWMEKELEQAWKAHPHKREALRQYTIDRYDGAVHFIDAEIARLLEVLGPDATVVVFADHGEEFWEHGAVGHGHSLDEELVRVPLIVRSPGLPAGRSARPATLADIVPTVMELVGLQAPEGLVGQSLLGPEDPERPIALGTTLFGPSALGVVWRGHKWQLRGTEELLQVLGQDEDVSAGQDLGLYREAYERALGRPLQRVIRVLADNATRAYLKPPGQLVIEVPGGVAAMWPRPGGSFRFQLPEPGEHIEVTGRACPVELFLVPSDPEAKVQVSGGTMAWTLRPEGGPLDSRQLSDAVLEELEALGYVE